MSKNPRRFFVQSISGWNQGLNVLLLIAAHPILTLGEGDEGGAEPRRPSEKLIHFFSSPSPTTLLFDASIHLPKVIPGLVHKGQTDAILRGRAVNPRMLLRPANEKFWFGEAKALWAKRTLVEGGSSTQKSCYPLSGLYFLRSSRFKPNHSLPTINAPMSLNFHPLQDPKQAWKVSCLLESRNMHPQQD